MCVCVWESVTETREAYERRLRVGHTDLLSVVFTGFGEDGSASLGFGYCDHRSTLMGFFREMTKASDY